eukprot:2145055-Prymnesium_polylepis.1
MKPSPSSLEQYGTECSFKMNAEIRSHHILESAKTAALSTKSTTVLTPPFWILMPSSSYARSPLHVKSATSSDSVGGFGTSLRFTWATSPELTIFFSDRVFFTASSAEAALAFGGSARPACRRGRMQVAAEALAGQMRRGHRKAGAFCGRTHPRGEFSHHFTKHGEHDHREHGCKQQHRHRVARLRRHAQAVRLVSKRERRLDQHHERRKQVLHHHEPPAEHKEAERAREELLLHLAAVRRLRFGPRPLLLFRQRE